MNTTPYAMGWQPDLPDIRDYTIETPVVKSILDKSAPLKSYRNALPDDVDLRKWCSPIEDQENIGSCTANAGVGLMEYYQRRVFGKHLDLSRLFLYKTTRNLLGWDGDTGAYLRTTMKAMVMLGVCPEQHLPYYTMDFDEEPEAFHYALAQNFQSVKYFRLDVFGIQGQLLLERRVDSIPDGWGQGGRRTRHRGGGLRRPAGQRRPSHPQQLGDELGTRRLRVAALRVRPARAGQ